MEENQIACSNFIKCLVQDPLRTAISTKTFINKIPKKIIQFWDNLDRLPQDVRNCIDTWYKVEELGIERLLFDSNQAETFINQKLGTRYKQAYDKCYHPAMQSDYFRLCYIFVEGGCYIDADDVYNEVEILHLFNDGCLKIQPLCYDLKKNMMVPPSVFTKKGVNNSDWIFYFNNNPLIASRGHPIIKLALENATQALEQDMSGTLPDIQSTTGPGNLTKSIFTLSRKNKNVGESIQILHDWEKIATSKWPLSYRNDERNWRLSDRRKPFLINEERDK